VADSSSDFGRTVERQRRRKIKSRYASHAQDDKTRHQEIEAGGEGKIDHIKKRYDPSRSRRKAQSASGSSQSSLGYRDGEDSVERFHADRAQGFY
jgi:hypothetical protein